jgi:Na+-transporting NADH:ubiquinone oxidoreductase subunit A
MYKLKLTLSLAFVTQIIQAQSQESPSSGFLLYSVVALCALLVVWAILSLASNLMKIEANKYGLLQNGKQLGIFPGIRDFFISKKPNFIKEGTYHQLDKGYDIHLAGKAEGSISQANVSRFGILPTDFHGMSPIPKVEYQVGDEVKAGDILFYDKKKPEIKYCAPVSGELIEVRRGEKRSISAVVILADKTIKYRGAQVPDIYKVDRSTLVEFMAEHGLWPFINERPFDVVPQLATIPENIFISTFDTAPLAPDNNLIVAGQEEAFQKGLNVLALLTPGKVHLGLDGRGVEPAKAFTNAYNVEKHWFNGPHPSGNVGVHIHHIAPIKSGGKVWTLTVQSVITIGQFFLTGHYKVDRIVALTGAELKEPKYVRTYQGASISDLVKENLNGENLRLISGDVLSGAKVDIDGFLGWNADQITVVKEGNYYELFGWLLPLKPRPSTSATIPCYGGKDFEFEADTNTHGEKRAFVVSGQYEQFLPMDIYPMHLMKAIISNDVEKMEGLGISELTEEDVALCEFACTSKNPLQSILRQGLENLKEQL